MSLPDQIRKIEKLRERASELQSTIPKYPQALDVTEVTHCLAATLALLVEMLSMDWQQEHKIVGLETTVAQLRGRLGAQGIHV